MRYLLGADARPRIDAQVIADAALLGMIVEAPADQPPDEFEVWPECEESLELFLAMNTQWKIDGMSGAVLGLDYPALNAVMDMTGVTDRRQTFEDVRAMEAEALRIYRTRQR